MTATHTDQTSLPPLSTTERIVYGLMRVLAYMPLCVWRALGFVFGWVLYLLLDRFRGRKQIADKNLQICFPRLSAAKRQRIIRQHCIRLAQSVLDRIWLWHGSHALLRKRVRLQGDAAFLQGETPIILFAPHFIGMDAGGPLIAQLPPVRKKNCITIYSPLHNAPVDRWVRRGRCRFPNVLPVWKGDGIKPIVSSLRKGGVLYLLPDMNFGVEESIFVNFFNHPAATLPSMARLARLGKAQVITAVTFLEPHGYTLHLGKPWENYPTDDVYADTQRMNTHLEAWIRQRPEEYFWLHKRFKSQPEGKPEVYE